MIAPDKTPFPNSKVLGARAIARLSIGPDDEAEAPRWSSSASKPVPSIPFQREAHRRRLPPTIVGRDHIQTTDRAPTRRAARSFAEGIGGLDLSVEN